jgi:hypothetical protein
MRFSPNVPKRIILDDGNAIASRVLVQSTPVIAVIAKVIAGTLGES